MNTALFVCQTVTPRLALRLPQTSDCLQAGGVFMTKAGMDLIEKQLEGSELATDEHIDALAH